jgi:RNA polymerase sigma-70 factor (ECF subfamily)
MEEAVPDELLMARYADGDARAFDELFRRYEPRAYAFFLKRTGSPQRAEDLYQGLFLRIHRARDRYDPARPFAPWFFRIARRLVVDDVRRAFRAHEVPLHDRDPQAEVRGSEDRLASRERVDRLLARLSPEERYVLVTAKVGGVGYPDLAEDLGRSAAAVRKMASRAMQRLRAAGDLPATASHAS